MKVAARFFGWCLVVGPLVWWAWKPYSALLANASRSFVVAVGISAPAIELRPSFAVTAGIYVAMRLATYVGGLARLGRTIVVGVLGIFVAEAALVGTALALMALAADGGAGRFPLRLGPYLAETTAWILAPAAWLLLANSDERRAFERSLERARSRRGSRSFRGGGGNRCTPPRVNSLDNRKATLRTSRPRRRPSATP